MMLLVIFPGRLCRPPGRRGPNGEGGSIAFQDSDDEMNVQLISEPGTEKGEPGTGNQEPGTRSLEPVAGSQEEGTRNQEPGARGPEPVAG
jgi:hypothetical protein